MSALTTPTPGARRRMLERQGMTPEQELELLVAEQEADDTYYVDRPSGHVSLDAPMPDGQALGDVIGRDPWATVDDAIELGLDPTQVAYAGELLVDAWLPPTPPMANADQHGTIYAYMRLGCRCVPCSDANREYMRGYMREYRARKKAA